MMVIIRCRHGVVEKLFPQYEQDTRFGAANAPGKPKTKPSIAGPNRLYSRHLFERVQCSDIFELH
jgi:hypothetical protein